MTPRDVAAKRLQLWGLREECRRLDIEHPDLQVVIVIGRQANPMAPVEYGPVAHFGPGPVAWCGTHTMLGGPEPPILAVRGEGYCVHTLFYGESAGYSALIRLARKLQWLDLPGLATDDSIRRNAPGVYLCHRLFGLARPRRDALTYRCVASCVDYLYPALIPVPADLAESLDLSTDPKPWYRSMPFRLSLSVGIFAAAVEMVTLAMIEAGAENALIPPAPAAIVEASPLRMIGSSAPPDTVDLIQADSSRPASIGGTNRPVRTVADLAGLIERTSPGAGKLLIFLESMGEAASVPYPKILDAVWGDEQGAFTDGGTVRRMIDRANEQAKKHRSLIRFGTLRGRVIRKDK